MAGQSVLLRDVHEVERTQQGFRKLPAIHVFYGDRIGAGFLTGILLLIQVFYNSCPARHAYQLSAASSLEYSYVSYSFSLSGKDLVVEWSNRENNWTGYIWLDCWYWLMGALNKFLVFGQHMTLEQWFAKRDP